MSYNSKLVDGLLCLSGIQSIGVATRIYSFQSPTFPTTIVSIDAAADACDSTDKPTVSVYVGGTIQITGSAITTGNTISKVVTADSGKSLNIAADTLIEIYVTCAGTAANVTGISFALWLKPNIFS